MDKIKFLLEFPDGIPSATSQQKGERIIYSKNGKAFIHHYKKKKVADARAAFVGKLKPYAPEVPSDKPVKLTVWFEFSVKDKKKWGKYKTTRADLSNLIKELEDSMTECGYWIDDSQIVVMRLYKTYAQNATIHIAIEELGDKPELLTEK